MNSRYRSLVPLMIAVLLLVNSCTTGGHPNSLATTSVTPTTTPEHTTGVITGAGSPCVGPYVPHPHYTAFVELTDAANSAQTQNVEDPYTFRFVVQPGVYTLSEPGARSVIVHAVAGQTVHADLVAVCR